MKFINQSIFFLCAAMLLSWGTQAQQDKGNVGLWSDVSEKQIPKVGTRYITPHKYRTLKLNLATMREILNVAPMEFTPVAQMTKTYLELPMPDGTMKTFDIIESPIMAPELSEKFPDINTYAGYAVGDQGMYLRFDLTPKGFHAMILVAGGSTIFIDPYSFGGGDIEHYISYYRDDYASSVPKVFDCGVTEYYDHSKNNGPLPDLKAAYYGTCELRTYRLAVAATGEYTTFHGGTVAGALAAQVTSMNRVNGLYEKDMAIRMNIVANNNLIIYTNAGTDPYTNNNGATMLNENQTNLTNIIGGANYDIGHVFSTGGGGIAQLGSVCSSSGKARGVTGSPAPVGDPFDIDYVAHEMGHQFAANHTQNNNCNRNNATAMEPGSASTIMGYAGICAPNVQNNSDDYFHNISLQEIGAFITGAGHTCPVKTPLANQSPTVTITTAAINVPRSTPFSLTATGADPNTTNVLTYCWEQMDNQTSTQAPVATATGGPNFRTFDPSTSPTRYFPNLTALAANGPFTWEVLPSVARTMNFRVGVRDNAPGGGCTAHANMTVAVDAGSGPFEVTYPTATGISWAGNSTQTVTWTVANTTNAPVSCANVDILLSTNGGATYTVVLANTPNDGTQVITVPNTPSTTCRIMVRCSNGYFFDISNNNFTITAATFDYTLSVSNTTVSVCQPTSAVYNISIGNIGGFTNAVTLSLTGLPAGATSNFSTNPVTPVGTSNLTIGNIGAVAPGTYSMTLTATSTSGTKTVDLTLVVSSTAPTAVTLLTPANASIGNNNPVSFTWTAASGAGVSYIINISTNAAFTGIIETATVTTNSYASTATLASGATYYWRVTAVTGCGTAPASATFSFTMSTCNTYTSTNVPLTISPTGVQTITSTVNVPLTGTITDVNVTNLVGTHTYMSDLIFRLSSPTVPNVVLFRNICTDQDNWNIKFDQAAASATLPCPPTDGNYYRPAGTLNAFNGANPNGNWTLTIVDSFDVDGGSLTAWAIQVCVATPAACAITTTASAQSNVACFGNSTGAVTVTGSGAVAPYTYIWSNGRTTAANTGLAAGTYTVTVTDANSCSTTRSVTITQPSAALATTAGTTTNVACFGGTTASTSVNVTGGTTGYSYLWSNGRTTAANTGLAAGTYTVTVTDANGCTATRSFTITQPTAALATTAGTTTNVACFGASTGSTSVNVTGGTTGYSYLWSNGRTTAANTGLAAGTYTVTVTDANGCTATRSFTITQPATGVNATVGTTTNVACFGNNNGSTSVTVAGGSTPYTYIWSNGRTTATNTGLAGGTYNVTVTDAGGCTSIRSITITQPSAALATTAGTTTNVACFGGSTASTSVNVTGGTTGYNYLWSNGRTTATNTGLAAGTYTVTVTDANACTATRSFTITQPTAALASTTTSVTNATCATSGAVNISVTGGTTGYTFNWSNAANTEDINGLSAGSYTVTITDANGCSVVNGPNTVTSVGTPTANLTSTTNISCNGGTNGAANITVSGGTPAYTFLWSNGRTTEDVTGLTAGTYSVTVTDASGCIASIGTVNITQPAALSGTSTATNVACNGGSTGAVNLSVTGGTSGYTFVWSNSANTEDLSNVIAGTYTVTITDAAGCTATRTATVTQPSALNPTLGSATNVACFGNATGGVSLTTGGTGTAPYTFVWSNGNTAQNLSNVVAGSYTVTVTDANGCATTRSATITQPTAALTSTTTSLTNATCTVAGAINISVSGGTAAYTFNWSNGANTEDISGLSAGSYTVTITDANGCLVVNGPNTITSSSTLTTNISSVSNVSCNGVNDGATTLTINGGTPGYSYLWSNGATTQNLNGLGSGSYSVTITDANGCVSTASAVVQEPAVLSSSAVSGDPSGAGVNDGTIDLTVTGGTSPYSYNWSNGATTQDLLGLGAGSYSVTITDANGCTTVQNVNLVSAVQAIGLVQNFVIMPNPSSGQFTIQVDLATAQDLTIQLVDVLGRHLRDWNLTQATQVRIPVDISEQAGGMYLIVLRTANGEIQTKKVTVSK